MKSTVEQLSPTRVKIAVEVPFEELKADFDRAYKTLAQQVNVPGFRRGKVPARILEARIGRGPVLEQVVNDMLPSRYSEAVEANDLRVLGQPDIDVTKIEDGELVEFTAEVDVRPEIALPDFTAISVEVDAVAVGDDDVDVELDELRARFGSLKTVERAAKTGDFLTIDLAAEVDGKAVEEAATSGMSYEVGTDNLVAGLDDAVVGLSAGESKEFDSTLVAGEHADAAAKVTVTVGAVKERELPDADDEFAQMASEFDTIEELREDLRAKAEQRVRVDQATEIRDKVLEAVLEATEVPVPEAVVDAEAKGQIDQMLSQFGGDESILDILFQSQGTTREEFEAQNREQAEKSVRTQLVLDVVAEEREISVAQEELTEHILFQAQRYGMDPNVFVQQIQQAGQLGALFADVRRGKALAGIVNAVTVKDTAGAVVDTAEMFGSDDAEGATAEADDTEGTDA